MYSRLLLCTQKCYPTSKVSSSSTTSSSKQEAYYGISSNRADDDDGSLVIKNHQSPSLSSTWKYSLITLPAFIGEVSTANAA